MSIIVQKFGGTSVADASKIQAAAKRAVAAHSDGYQVVMVVSARGKKTDELIGLAQEITDSPAPREMDMLLSTGEQESVALMAMAVRELGVEAVSLTGSQIGVQTDSSHTKARICRISTARISRLLEEGKIVIAAGFQGVDPDANITTLGRGGSDTTAAALAAVVKAEECQVYTDVEGVFTTDPRLVSEARKVEVIAYDEMLELASLGAGVMHSRSIEFAKKYRVPVRVRPAHSSGDGTLIVAEPPGQLAMVTGVALVRNEARVSLRDLPDRPGVMSIVFAKMAERKIPIDMVVQNVGSGETADVSFTVPQDDLAETLTAAEGAIRELGAGRLEQGTNLSKVSVVGIGMRQHTGVAAHLFRLLAEADINIQMVTTSEIKISVLVDRDLCDEAVRRAHAGFELDRARPNSPDVGRSHALPEAQGVELQRREESVVASLPNMEDIVVSEVLLDEKQSRITLESLPDRPGVLAAVFSAVAESGIMVDMIVQNVAQNGLTHLSFTVPRGQHHVCCECLQGELQRWPDVSIHAESEIAKLTVVGIGLRSHTGVGERMFAALSNANINVRMINTSEIRMSAVVASESGPTAMATLTETFGLSGDLT